MRIDFSSRPFFEDAPNPMPSLLGKCLAARRMIRKGSMIALDLSGTDVGAAELGAFFEGPKSLLGRVYALDISTCPYLTPLSTWRVAHGLLNLQVVSMSNLVSAQYRIMVSCTKMVELCPKLAAINISRNLVNVDQFDAFLRAITERGLKVKQLDVSYVYFEESKTPQWDLLKLTHLRRLDLSGTIIYTPSFFNLIAWNLELTGIRKDDLFNHGTCTVLDATKMRESHFTTMRLSYFGVNSIYYKAVASMVSFRLKAIRSGEDREMLFVEMHLRDFFIACTYGPGSSPPFHWYSTSKRL